MASSVVLASVSDFYISRSDRCVVVSHCDFNFAFPLWPQMFILFAVHITSLGKSLFKSFACFFFFFFFLMVCFLSVSFLFGLCIPAVSNISFSHYFFLFLY